MKFYSHRTKKNHKSRLFLNTLVETSNRQVTEKWGNLSYMPQRLYDGILSLWVGTNVGSVCTFHKIYLTLTKMLVQIQRRIVNAWFQYSPLPYIQVLIR